MQEPQKTNPSNPCHWDDQDSVAWNCEPDNDNDYDNHSYYSGPWQHEPIVVAYAFGPKKMKSMGMVMAEASRVPVIHEEVEEFTEAGQGVATGPGAGFREGDPLGYWNNGDPEAISGYLTSSALRDLDPGSAHQASTIITLGNSNETNLKHIVRYFRSSCSSAASMSETTVSTPTTTATVNSSKRSSKQSPVRISFVPLDTDTPLEEQHGGHFDLILHKLTEDILTCSLNDHNKEAALHRVQSLKRYQELVNPSCCLVDDPSNVQTLMSRSDIAEVLQSCLGNMKSASGIRVRAPKFLVVDTAYFIHFPDKIEQQLLTRGLSVPLIVKPLVAAGTKESHSMTVVLKHLAFSQLTPGYIVQEYVNHDATLFKVYVLGENVYVYERSSLPNLPPANELTTALDYLKFDSQRPYPRIQDFGMSCDGGPTGFVADDHSTNFTSCGTHSPITADEVRPLVERLRQAFGLELFGFDILVSRDEGEWLVVDVNYFPSYKEVPNFPSLLAHYLTQRVLTKRRR